MMMIADHLSNYELSKLM